MSFNLFNMASMGGFLKKPVKEEVIKRNLVTRKCPTCNKKMMQGRMVIHEKGRGYINFTYCPTDVGLIADGIPVAAHDSYNYDPAYYCETCKTGTCDFTFRLQWGDMPKVLKVEREKTNVHCPYCDKPMEEGNLFVVYQNDYVMDWYDESVYEDRYIVPRSKRSFALLTPKEYPNAHVCKKCKKVFARFPLGKDFRKDKPENPEEE